MKYEDPEYSNQSILDLDSEDPVKVSLAIIAICLYGGDYDLSVNSVRKTLKHDNENVVGCAIVSIGHIARLWGKVPDDLKKVVENTLKDSSDYLRGIAGDAMSDMKIFIKDIQQ